MRVPRKARSVQVTPSISAMPASAAVAPRARNRSWSRQVGTVLVAMSMDVACAARTLASAVPASALATTGASAEAV